MFNKKDKLAEQIVIASGNAISYNDARNRVETYYRLKRKHPFKFWGEHLNLDNMAKIMAEGMLRRV